MKPLLLATAVLASSMGAATAQEATYDWSGVYLGLQGGFGDANAWIVDTEGLRPYALRLDPNGGFVGAHIGSQWQSGVFVFGAEAEINVSPIDISVDVSSNSSNFFKTDIKWFGATNAKAGVAIDRILVYGTAGVSTAKIYTGQELLSSKFLTGKTYVGWTVGAGIDLTVTDNIIADLRYRYYDFGKADFDIPWPFTGRSEEVKIHTIGVGIAYKF